MMNKKGTIFLGVILGITLFVFGVLFMPFIADDITTARTELNCSDADNITGGAMLQCLLISALMPYFIWFFISASVGFVGSKL